MVKWILALVLIVLPLSVQAETSRSANFESTESFVGGGGLVLESSPNYQAGESIGDTAIGDSSSSNFSINGGYTTTGDPTLAFGITNNNVNFGTLSAGAAATATAGFEVSNYTSYGYVVQVLGNPPSNNGHTLPSMTTGGPSQAGVEQFGLNLVSNTSPIAIGSSPDNGTSGLGTAAGGYDTANTYKYVSGETVASAPKTSGLTKYTISYIINVSSLSPGGQYTSAQTLVCTGTY